MRGSLVCVAFLLLAYAQPALAVGLPGAVTPALPIEALSLEVQVQARVEEGHLLLQQDLRWTLPDGVGQVTMDGVIVPLFFPVVGDPPMVVDRGIIPPTTQSVEIEAEGGLKVVRAAESLVLKGVVGAGKTEFVRVRLAVPLSQNQLQLGLSGHSAGKTWLSFAALSSPPARIALALNRPGRVTRFEEGRERLVGATLAQPLGRKDVVALTLRDLPALPRQPGRALAWFAGAVALAGLAGLAVRRRVEPQS